MCEHHAHQDRDMGPLGGLTGLIHCPAARLAPGDVLIRTRRWVVRSVNIDLDTPPWARVVVRASEQEGERRQTIAYRAKDPVHIERRLIEPPADPEREFLILMLLELDADLVPPSDQLGS